MTATLSSPAAPDVAFRDAIARPAAAPNIDRTRMETAASLLSVGQKQPVLERDRPVERAAKLVGGTLLPGGYFLADRVIAHRVAARLHRRLDRAFSEEKHGPTTHSPTTQRYMHWLIDRDVRTHVSHDMRESLLDHGLFEVGGVLVTFASSSSESLVTGLGHAVFCYGATKIFELVQNRRRNREHDIPRQVNAIVRLRAGNALWSRMARGR